MPLKLEKLESRLFYKIILPLQYRTLSNMLGFYENDSILNATFFGFYKDSRHIEQNKRCHMTLQGLSNVYAKLEPASSKNNEILETNVLQKFTSRAHY